MSVTASAKLVRDLFAKNISSAPTRDGFGHGLYAAAQTHPNVVVLCADLSESTRVLEFKQHFPERFVQMGVSEQALAAIASGMALAEKFRSLRAMPHSPPAETGNRFVPPAVCRM